MITVTFDGQLRYRRAPGFVAPSPLFEVILHWSLNSTPRFLALLDTGSTRTIFKWEFAESLGISDLTTFPSITIQTGGGPLSAHLVDAELEILLGERNRFGCQVGESTDEAAEHLAPHKKLREQQAESERSGR